MTIFEIIAVVGALTGIARVTFHGYAEIEEARAWKRWAERCHPKGFFGGPPDRKWKGPFTKKKG